MNDKTASVLRGLARTYRILPSFENNDGEICRADPETLVHLINSLEGEKILDAGSPDEQKLRALLDEKRRTKIKSCLPGAVTAWEGNLAVRDIWLPDDAGSLTLTARSDNGEEISESWEKGEYEINRRTFSFTDKSNLTKCKTRLKFSRKIPYGYYQLELQNDGKPLGKSFLVSSPRKLGANDSGWGAFGPVYAMRSENDWGIGGFSELQKVCSFIREKGGRFVGTLPLLAGFMEGPRANYSPYSPLTRLFWNELYLDIENLPGIPALEIENSDRILKNNLGADFLIEYGEIYALKKKYILKAAERFFSGDGEEWEDFKNFLSEYPWAEDYAGFRSREAPEQQRREMYRYHLYAQFAAHRQLQEIKNRADSGGAAELYLDYPVGVHNDGYDADRMPHLFIPGFNVGAPPDDFSDNGQDWGFMPLHPDALIEDNFQYFRDSIHNYFRYARIIRLDHIMGFYRIFCVPHGESPRQGAYIKYPFDAFLAVLCLETWRHDGVLIGEDLGTVPPVVREAMERHGILRTWLFQFYLHKDPGKTFRSVPEQCLAALNTHDMFPFKSFIERADIKRLENVGVISEGKTQRLLKERKDILSKWKEKDNPFLFIMENMAKSSARFLLVNLEDLWEETQPQNLPGTTDQYPNWRRKFSLSLETWMKDSKLNEVLKSINDHKKHKEPE